MNRYRRIFAASLLLSAGAALAQPTWDEGESFDAFRKEWNAWAGSLPDDERAAGGLADVLERFNDERQRDLDPLRGIWSSHVVDDCRPWNECWAFREEGLEVYRAELDAITRLAYCSYFAAQIPGGEDQPELGQDDEYLPSFSMQEYQVGSVSPIRDAVRYLVSDAVYHAFEARQELAVQRFEAASRLCAFSLELPTELGFITELPCRQVVREAIIESIKYDPDLFNDAQLARLQALLISDLSTDYSGVWDFDGRVAHADWRASFKDEDPYHLGLLAARYHDDASLYTRGEFKGFFTQVIQPDLDPRVDLAPVAQQITIHERILKAMQEDLQASPVTTAELLSSEQVRAHLSGDSASRFIPVYLDTALWRTQLGLIHRNNYETANQIAVISIYRHRARHGEWPASLAEIDPKALPIPAIDYYSGEPLRYTLIDGEPRLWALGADRDDDGGRPVPREKDEPNPGWSWFTLGEWDQLSKDQRSKLDGDLCILNEHETPLFAP